MIKLILKEFLISSFTGGLIAYLVISVLLNTLHLKVSIMLVFGAFAGVLNISIKFIEAFNLWRKDR